MTEDSALANRVRETISRCDLADSSNACLLMVSGGSDSTALAYVMKELLISGDVGPLAMLHVNHMLRGSDAEDDQMFVEQLAHACDIPFFSCEIDVAAVARRSGSNVEAVGRQERYSAAADALKSLCAHSDIPFERGRIVTAHTQNDRVENFYMRSIVGTGPGGFRSMKYRNGPVIRPLLDVSRDDLRSYITGMATADASIAAGDVCVVKDGAGMLWREDATNAHTDRFRAFVRHEIIPKAQMRNSQLLSTLSRTMNLIGDEDDMLEEMTSGIVDTHVLWTVCVADRDPDYASGCVVSPGFAREPLPLQRRACMRVLRLMLGDDQRPETASIDAMVAGFDSEGPISGYTANIQGDIALSANKRGLRVEPMSVYRARRKKG